MDLGLKVLSDLTVWSKYAKYLPNEKRRETWDEIVDRYEGMMVNKFPSLKEKIVNSAKYIREKKVLPSMRALQFAGLAIEVNNARAYNCAFHPIESVHSFSETMFLLLGGTGVGYSVQRHHVEKLSPVIKPTKTRRYVIQDSIIGWADAVKVLMKSYLEGHALPDFDFRDIRPKGSRLITAGGKAPGPEPLKECLFEIQKVLDRKNDGEKLTPIECHDILCHIANAVLAGGIRRAAMIALFDKEDNEMMTCKYGSWWELNEQRGRSNNSTVLLRGEVEKEEFLNIWKKIEYSNSGEPGIYWTNDESFDWGTNPCAEIGLRPYQFCNLCEINVDNIVSQQDLNIRSEIAAFFGTLQASFTDFHYLRPIWKRTTEKDALLGIGMTGIASGRVLNLNLKESAEIAVKTNIEIASIIGINRAARVTTVKPSGTTSCVLGCSSGIHAWYAKYYLRTMRFKKHEDVALYFIVNHPELVEDDILRPHDTICVRIPIKAPDNAILRTESAIDTLERVKRFANEWIKPGHIDGVNSHNVSATIYIDKNREYAVEAGSLFFEVDENFKKGKRREYYNEWFVVGEWMWDNKEFYNGISVLPYDSGTYVQAPFEEITKEKYEELAAKLTEVDMSKVIEDDDNQNFGAIAACAGANCEITI